MWTWTEFVMLMIETSGEFLWIRNVPSEFVKRDTFLE